MTDIVQFPRTHRNPERVREGETVTEYMLRQAFEENFNAVIIIGVRKSPDGDIISVASSQLAPASLDDPQETINAEAEYILSEVLEGVRSHEYTLGWIEE